MPVHAEASDLTPLHGRMVNRRLKLEALRTMILNLLATKPHSRALLFARAVTAGFSDRAGLISGALAVLEDDGLIRQDPPGTWSLVTK